MRPNLFIPDGSPERSFGINTKLQADERSRVRFPAGVRNFPLLHIIQTGSEAHSASYPMGSGECSPEAMRLQLEADDSPTTNAEFSNVSGRNSKNSWRGA
jgi:hypothetical protein